MKQLRALYQRVGYTVSSFVLALSMVTAAVPFILSEGVGAAPGIVASSSGFNSLTGWATDRAPVSSYSFTDSALTMNIDGDSPHPSASNAFYKTEGLSANLPAHTNSIKATLKVDADWQNVIGVRAGIWGVTPNPSSYPILEFSNRNEADHSIAGTPRLQAWATGIGWISIPVAVQYGNSYEFEVVYNESEATFDYYIDGVKVTTATADNGPLTKVIFNNFNAGIAGNDYSVTWTNFQTGTRETKAPTNLRFLNRDNSAIIATGSTVKSDNVTLYWDTVANAERYQVRVTAPNGTQQSDRQTGWYTFALDDATRHGFFGTQQGTWSYEVRTKDATTGLWSAYTAPVSLKFDSVAPSVVAKADTVTLPENTPSDPVVLIAGANPTTFQVNLTDEHDTPNGAYIELFKANWDGSYGNWVKDNTNGAGNVRHGANPKLVFNTSTLNGKYGLKIVSSDNVSNSKTSYHFFTVDSSAPEAPVLTGDAVRYMKPGNVIRTWDKSTATDVKHYIYKSFTSEAAAQTPDTSAGWSPAPYLAGQDSYSISHPTGDSNRTIYYRVAAVDFAGNKTWSVDTFKVVVDKDDPVVSISGVSDGGVYRGPVTVSGLVEDANHSHFYLTVTKDGVNQTISGATGTRTAESFEFDLSDEGVYTIKLEARDLAGNKGPESTVELSFTIDNTAPVLTLNGGDVTLTVGDLYVEQGATASDVVDGNLTDNIVIDSSLVNTGVVGVYTVTYTVADEAGNTSTATRTVTVVEPAPQVVDGEDGTSDDDDDDEPAEVAAVLFPGGFANIIDTNPDLTPDTEDAEDADQDVAGATTDNAAQVAGASDEASWLGLAWYWWVLIGAAVLGAGWWLAGAIRRRGAEAEA